MDRVGADFSASLTRFAGFGSQCGSLAIPVDQTDFKGIIDLVKMSYVVYIESPKEHTEDRTHPQRRNTPRHGENLIGVAEIDEELLDKYCADSQSKFRRSSMRYARRHRHIDLPGALRFRLPQQRASRDCPTPSSITSPPMMRLQRSNHTGRQGTRTKQRRPQAYRAGIQGRRGQEHSQAHLRTGLFGFHRTGSYIYNSTKGKQQREPPVQDARQPPGNRRETERGRNRRGRRRTTHHRRLPCSEDPIILEAIDFPNL